MPGVYPAMSSYTGAARRLEPGRSRHHFRRRRAGSSSWVMMLLHRREGCGLTLIQVTGFPESRSGAPADRAGTQGPSRIACPARWTRENTTWVSGHKKDQVCGAKHAMPLVVPRENRHPCPVPGPQSKYLVAGGERGAGSGHRSACALEVCLVVDRPPWRGYVEPPSSAASTSGTSGSCVKEHQSS